MAVITKKLSKAKNTLELRYIPNVLKEEGRISFRLRHIAGKTISQYIENTGLKFDILKSKVIISGKKIDDLKFIPKNSDQIIITNDIKFQAALGAIYGAGSFWASVGMWADVVIAVASLGYGIYGMFNTPRAPSYGTITDSGGIDSVSPTYGWKGIKTTMDVGVPVAICYGEHLLGGNVLSSWIRTDGDKNYLNVLLGLCEGEIEAIAEGVGELLINDNPSENFSGITLSRRYGTVNQSIIPNFEDLHNMHIVDVTLTKNNPHVYTTIDSDVEGFSLYLQSNGGIYQQDSDTGAATSWTITYKVEYKLHTDVAWTDLGSTDIVEKSKSTVRRIYRKVGLTPGQYDIRVTRTSDDSSLDPVKQGDLVWEEVDEIKTDDFIYPHTALLAIEALASEQLEGSMPNFGVIVKGKKISIPKVMYSGVEVDWIDYYWDPDDEVYRRFIDGGECSWDGETYVERWCANPVWCLLDLLTNTRYGLGEYIVTDLIDMGQMIEQSQYCEEKVPDGDGGYEKRFRLDIVIDGAADAPTIISQICAAMRGLPPYPSGLIKFRIDRPEEPVQLFTMGNIVEHSFSQSWKSMTETPNVVDVQFLDKDKNYAQDYATYEDSTSLAAGDPTLNKTVKVFTTSRSQACREARYAQKVAKYVTRTVSFKAFIDAIVCTPGEVISISHDVPQWGYSGRAIQNGTLDRIFLDRDVQVQASKSYIVRVQFEDDTIEERYVANPAGTYNYIDVTVPFSQIPKEYNKYSFGLSTAYKKDFRIISMKRDKSNEVEISCSEYDARCYDDSDVELGSNNYSMLDFSIPPVEDLALTEEPVTLPDGTVESAISVWFRRPDITDYNVQKFDRARIWLSDNGGLSYKRIVDTTADNYQIKGGLSYGIEYTVLVSSVSAGGQELGRLSCPTETITLVGKATPPANVAGFAYAFDAELVFTWNKSTEKDLAGYEIRTEDANWGVQSSKMVYRGLANTFTIVRPSTRTPGTFYIKAFDTTGNYSTTAASVAPSNDAPAAPTLSSTVWFGMATLDWADSTEPDLKYYEVWKSETGAWAGEETLYKKVSGSQANLMGKVSVNATAGSPDATSITDASLIGAGVNEYVGDYLRQTSGTYKDQVAIVTGFDNDTGKLTVASWPSGTPTAGDSFVITDRAFFKVCGVDSYGSGTLSASKAISFDPLSEFLLEDGSVTTDKLADEAVTADKLYSGEIITLSAQIKDAIITSAKIYSLEAEKIVAGILTGFTIRTSDAYPRVELSGDSLKIYDAGGNLVVILGDIS